MLNLRLVVVFLLVALLGACSNYHYTYDGHKYTNSREALDAQTLNLTNVTNEIDKASQSISGKAVLLTPSRTTVEALGMTRTGSPKRELVEYVSTSQERSYEAFAGFLDASGAFSSVESRVVDFPQKDAREIRKDYAATIYLQMKSPTQVGWFMFAPSWKSPKPIVFDTLSSPGAPKVNSWISSVIQNMDIPE